jgi:hypothetical protein
MGIFTTILSKLGISAPKEQPAPKPAAAKTAAQTAADKAAWKKRIQEIQMGKVKDVPMVDVTAKLEKLAAESPQKLNWKRSIVDLLKLLGIDSSFENRKALAIELGCPTNLMDDSAEMNTWLHKAVLEKIAENGGNIPMELLD